MSFFTKKHLGDFDKPEAVEIVCTVTSPSTLVSPMTGVAGAAFFVMLYQRYGADPRYGRPTSGGVEVTEPIGGMAFGGPLELAAEPGGEPIAIDLGTAKFRLASNVGSATPLERVPDALRSMVARAEKGLVCFNEMVLGAGIKVRLAGHVERVTDGASAGSRNEGAYRTASGITRFIVRPDLGEVVLEEIIETPNW